MRVVYTRGCREKYLVEGDEKGQFCGVEDGDNV
jgi:hypothetical protein